MRTALLVITLAAVPLAAMDSMADPETVLAAIKIGESPAARERLRFHALYHVVIAKAPVDYLEIITPFRRVELAAEAQALQGSRSFGQRQAREVLTAAPDQLDVRVELTFSPLNTFVGVPDYGVTLVATGTETPIEPRSIERTPRFGARVESLPIPVQAPIPVGRPRKSQTLPVAGGTLIARFDTRLLDASRSYDIVMTERVNGKVNELARGRVDLAALK